MISITLLLLLLQIQQLYFKTTTTKGPHFTTDLFFSISHECSNIIKSTMYSSLIYAVASIFLSEKHD